MQTVGKKPKAIQLNLGVGLKKVFHRHTYSFFRGGIRRERIEANSPKEEFQCSALQQKHHWADTPAKLTKLFLWNSNKINQYLAP